MKSTDVNHPSHRLSRENFASTLYNYPGITMPTQTGKGAIGIQGPIDDVWNQLNAERTYIEPAGKKYKPKYIGDLSFPDLLLEIQKLARAEKGKLAGPLPQYAGKYAPRSKLTDKSRALEAEYLSRKMPYSTKRSAVQSRNKEGFSPAQLDEFKRIVGKEDKTISDAVLKRMNKQFQKSYKGYDEQLQKKLGKESKYNTDVMHSFENIGEDLRNYAREHDISLVDLMDAMGREKNEARAQHVNILGELGNQQHTFGNLKEGAKERQFNRELFDPYRKLENLMQEVKNAGLESGNVFLGGQAMQKLQKALTDYGIDTTLPVNRWKHAVRPTNIGPGGKGWDLDSIEELPEEVMASQRTMMALDPKLEQAESRGRRKELEQDFLKGENPATRVFNKALANRGEYLRPMDRDLKRILKEESNKISNHFTRLNQHGSRQHQRTAEEKLTRIAREYMNKQKNVLANEVDKQINPVNRELDLNAKELKQLAGQRTSNFMDTLEKIRGYNEIGVGKWKNKQKKKEAEENQKLEAIRAEMPYVKGNNLSPLLISENPNLEAEYGQKLGQYMAKQPYAAIANNLNMSLPELKNRIATFDENVSEDNPFITEMSNFIKEYGNTDLQNKNDIDRFYDQSLNQAASLRRNKINTDLAAREKRLNEEKAKREAIYKENLKKANAPYDPFENLSMQERQRKADEAPGKTKALQDLLNGYMQSHEKMLNATQDYGQYSKRDYHEQKARYMDRAADLMEAWSDNRFPFGKTRYEGSMGNSLGSMRAEQHWPQLISSAQDLLNNDPNFYYTIKGNPQGGY